MVGRGSGISLPRTFDDLVISTSQIGHFLSMITSSPKMINRTSIRMKIAKIAVTSDFV